MPGTRIALYLLTTLDTRSSTNRQFRSAPTSKLPSPPPANSNREYCS